MAFNWRFAITGFVAGVLLFTPALCRAQGYTVTTVAGGGSPATGIGDGGPAILAFLLPAGLAVDGAGNLYIADGADNVIRKVTLDGLIATVAGDAINQQAGSSGDGGLATSAFLNGPGAVAVDPAGNIYIADTGNSRVRIVSPSGIITTFAGGGKTLGEGGPATSAILGRPSALATDSSGNLYIADLLANLVRKVGPDGTITTVAGGGAGLGDGGPATSAALAPLGLAVDASGNLYIADASSNRIREVSPAGTITTVAGNSSINYSGDGGPATSAALNLPSGVAVDSAGGIYIADSGNYRVRLVTPDGTINTIAGNGNPNFSGDAGPALNAGMTPLGVAVGQGGIIYVADRGADNRVRLLTPPSGP